MHGISPTQSISDKAVTLFSGSLPHKFGVVGALPINCIGDKLHSDELHEANEYSNDNPITFEKTNNFMTSLDLDRVPKTFAENFGGFETYK